MFNWATAITALFPVLIQGAGNIINKITGGPQPTTVDEVIKMQQADVAKMEALAKLDNPGGTLSQWVVDLRGSFRYIACIILIGTAMACILVPALSTGALAAVALDMASSAFFFLFGDKVLENYQIRQSNGQAKK